MKLGWLAMLFAGAVALVGLVGCSSAKENGSAAPNGVSGNSGAGSLSAGGAGSAGSADNSGNAGSGGNAGGALLTAGDCLENPSPQRTMGTVLSLPLRLSMAGKPFVFGEPNLLADGGSLIPLNLRFYISEVELLRSGGEQPVPVDVVTAAGAIEPYGVHLFNAEDAASSTLRVSAPPGEYTGLRFALGIKLACNQKAPGSLGEPLNDNSQMTWPHTGGFLFLRYEGRYTAAGGGGASGATSTAGIPPAVHMGGNIMKELVPLVTVPGALSVPASGTLEKGLSVAMDEIFKGATSNIDVSDVTIGLLSTPEAEAGERLRRGLGELHVFVLEP